MPTLRDLDGMFIRHESRGDAEYHIPVDRLEEAQGVRFLCPKCFAANGGKVGTHRVVCWSRSRGVPDEVSRLVDCS